MRCSLLVLALFIAVPAMAQTTKPADDFARLDEKLAKATAKSQWSEASLQFITAFMAEYKAAHAAGNWGAQRSGIGQFGVLTAESPADYVGTFGMPVDGGKARPIATITREADGRLFAAIEKHRIPVAPWNGAILITTGDIVYGQTMPQLGAKPHATLELLVIVKTKDGFAMTDPTGKPVRPLVKIETGAAQ